MTADLDRAPEVHAAAGDDGADAVAATDAPGHPVEGRSGRVITVVAVVLAVIAIPTALLVLSAWVTGRSLQVVESGSMAPTIPVGSLAVVAPVRPAEVAVGDVLVFDAEGRGLPTSHRVVAITPATTTEGASFTTQGDANATPDAEPVPATAVRGVVTHHVPGLGSWIGLLAWPVGPVLLVGVPLLLLAVDVGRERLGAGR